MSSKTALSLITLAVLALAARFDGSSAQPYSDRMGSGMMGHGMMGQQMGPGMMGRGMMGGGSRRPAPGASSSDNRAGAQIFASQCAMCHTLHAGGANTVGPNLHGVFGRKAGSLAGYDYSAAMRNSGIVWDTKTLDRFLADPARVVPGTKMAFPGVPDAKEREALIEYLKAAAG